MVGLDEEEPNDEVAMREHKEKWSILSWLRRRQKTVLNASLLHLVKSWRITLYFLSGKVQTSSRLTAAVLQLLGNHGNIISLDMGEAFALKKLERNSSVYW